MATFTAVLVVPDELDQEDLQRQLERSGVIAFLGPGSLVEPLRAIVNHEEHMGSGPPDDEMREIAARALGESDGLAGAGDRPVLLGEYQIDGFTVRLEQHRDPAGDAFVRLVGAGCALEGEMPGDYYPAPLP